MITEAKFPLKLIKTRKEPDLENATKFIFKNASTVKLVATMQKENTHTVYRLELKPEDEIWFKIEKTDDNFQFRFDKEIVPEIRLAPTALFDTIDLPNAGDNQLRYHAKFFKSSIPLIDFDEKRIVPFYVDTDGVSYGADNSYFTVTLNNDVITMAFHDPLAQ